MGILRTVVVVAAGAALLAGCGKAPEADPRKTSPTTVAAVLVTTTTQPGATTTTTDCIPASPTPAEILAAAQQKLQSDQATLDTNVAWRRQIDGAIADIQLTIDNAGRQIEIQQREVDSDQHDYDLASAAGNILGTDTAKQKMADAAKWLADAKAILDSWRAVRTKAVSDLARAEASAADYDKAINQDQTLVAADQRQVALATMTGTGDNCVH